MRKKLRREYSMDGADGAKLFTLFVGKRRVADYASDQWSKDMIEAYSAYYERKAEAILKGE